jgi:hypothetical protein
MKCRSAGNALKYHVLAAMRCFWLANHTQGANWETDKQIICPGTSRFPPEGRHMQPHGERGVEQDRRSSLLQGCHRRRPGRPRRRGRAGARRLRRAPAAARHPRGARGGRDNRASAGRGGRPAGTGWDVQAAAVEAASTSVHGADHASTMVALCSHHARSHRARVSPPRAPLWTTLCARPSLRRLQARRRRHRVVRVRQCQCAPAVAARRGVSAFQRHEAVHEISCAGGAGFASCAIVWAYGAAIGQRVTLVRGAQP